jgi:RNA polymerase sigma-70 factor (ECF subfamily)
LAAGIRFLLFSKMLSAPKPKEMTDDELTKLYKSKGELSVLGELYSRYTAMVFGVCLKYLKDRESSRDAVMQIFEKLVSALLEHDVEHFKSWLYILTRNYCLMQIRSQKNRKFEEISTFIMESDVTLHHDDEPELESNLSKLEGCIERLVNEQKNCVRLFYIQQKCYKEITTITGFDLNNVKSYIQNGKRNLKICMERNDRPQTRY